VYAGAVAPRHHFVKNADIEVESGFLIGREANPPTAFGRGRVAEGIPLNGRERNFIDIADNLLFR